MQLVKAPTGAWNAHLRTEAAAARQARPTADVQREQCTSDSACEKPRRPADIEQPAMKRRKTLVLPRLALPTPAASTGAAQPASERFSSKAALPRSPVASLEQHAAATAVIVRDQGHQASRQLQQSQHAAETAAATTAAGGPVTLQLQQPALRRNRKVAVTTAARSVASDSALAATGPADAAVSAAAAMATQKKGAGNSVLSRLPKQRAHEQHAIESAEAAATMGGSAVVQSACSNHAALAGLESMPAANHGAKPGQSLQDACTASLPKQAGPERRHQPAAKVQVDYGQQAAKTEHLANLPSSKKRPQRLPAVLTSVLPTLKDNCIANTLNAATLVGECFKLLAVQRRINCYPM